MKLTQDTRINAIAYGNNKFEGNIKGVQQRNMDISLIDLMIELCASATIKNHPVPKDIFNKEFDVIGVSYNEFGHKFTSLVYENKKEGEFCLINKLDLAGTF